VEGEVRMFWFWPPQNTLDYIMIACIAVMTFYGCYYLWQLIMYGLFKSYFQARREYLKTMKGDLEKWQKRDK
jgi:uncharacterized membrane protein (DUF373 family)